MKILVTNDDGITAAGLSALVAELATYGKVTVVAPDRERSGIGHAVTIKETFWVRCSDTLATEAYAVSGTPADCVRWALSADSGMETPDIVISGINHGYNCGFHIFYSGTVAAAIEAAALGVRSFAVSMSGDDLPNAGHVARIAAALIFDDLLNLELVPKETLNINIPQLDSMAGKTPLWTFQSKTFEQERFDCIDARSRKKFYRPRFGEFTEPEPGSDRWAVLSGYISVTRLACSLSVRNTAGTREKPRQ